MLLRRDHRGDGQDLHATRRYVAVNLPLRADENDSVARGVAAIPFHLLIRTKAVTLIR